jgi:hypothetical protein
VPTSVSVATHTDDSDALPPLGTLQEDVEAEVDADSDGTFPSEDANQDSPSSPSLKEALHAGDAAQEAAEALLRSRC